MYYYTVICSVCVNVYTLIDIYVFLPVEREREREKERVGSGRIEGNNRLHNIED